MLVLFVLRVLVKIGIELSSLIDFLIGHMPNPEQQPEDALSAGVSATWWSSNAKRQPRGLPPYIA